MPKNIILLLHNNTIVLQCMFVQCSGLYNVQFILCQIFSSQLIISCVFITIFIILIFTIVLIDI